MIQREFPGLLFWKKGLRIGQDFVTELLRALLHSRTSDKRLPGRVGSRVKRSYVCILYRHDMNIFHLQVKSLRRHLGKNSIRALADLRRSKLELYASVLV